MHTAYQFGVTLGGGVLITVELFLGASVLAMALSLLAGLLRLSKWRVIRVVTACYVEVFRGTSLVVQLFWLYFALPAFGISLDPFPTAIIALGLCFGAYGSEVVRGAIRSVSAAQYEAARALNFSYFDMMRCVILPQAFVLILPPYTNILIQLLKSTSAASMITIPELTFRATSLNQVTFATVPIFASVLVIYFLMALLISRSMRVLERRVGCWRSGVPAQ
jgi:polar amino acid transport system permease protein